MDPTRLMNAAMQLWAAGDRQGAVRVASQIIERAPFHPGANELLAAAHAQQGRWDLAEEHLTAAITGKPTDVGLHYALGCARGQRHDVAGAAAAFGRALEIEPGFGQAVTPCAIALVELGRSSEAESVLRRWLARNPQDVEAAAALGVVLADRAQTGEALQLLKAAFAANPSDAGLLAIIRQWLNYLDNTGTGEAPDLRRRYGEMVGEAAPWPAATSPNFLDPDRPLRIGYLSPDFKRHSVSYFFEPILSHHDRERYQVFCYSTGQGEDEVTARLRGAAGAWRSCQNADDVLLLQTIRQDGIDILIELSGHTTGNRLAALARRAAPIQMTYIGCPSSTGVAAIDHRIVDEVTDPPGAAQHASEHLLRLPGCFLCYLPPREAPEPAPPPCTLSADAPITFGSFNTLAKLSPETARLWARLLSAVPGSRLLLKGKALGDAAARASVERILAAHQCDTARLILLGDIPDMRGHLEAYSRIDIALDPIPYNGTTTTCEALWMGDPVVALRGNLHAGRVGASLLNAAGLSEWIADSAESYITIATGLAQNRSRLGFLRASQRKTLSASRLCDATAHTKALESGYRECWRAWVDSRRT